MKPRVEELISEIKQISAQYVEEVGHGGYRVWPRSIRDRALLLCDLIGSTRQAAELCGISKETIYQWRAEIKKSDFKSIAVVESKKQSLTVADATKTYPENKMPRLGTVTVTTPKGFIVSGLSIEQALDFLKQFGGI